MFVYNVVISTNLALTASISVRLAYTLSNVDSLLNIASNSVNLECNSSISGNSV